MIACSNQKSLPSRGAYLLLLLLLLLHPLLLLLLFCQ
jgi:hypothetical protein